MCKETRSGYRRTRRSRTAFTLVELVVVIMILGILATVAAPRLLDTSAVATDNGLRQTLAIVRDAIEMYAAENAGALPPCNATGSDFRTELEVYIRGNFPECPVGPTAAQNNTVLPVTGATTTGDASPTAGWKFNTDDGTFICNNSNATSSDGTVTYDSL